MSDIRETLVNITKSASKTTGDLFKTAKLNISLTNEQTSIKNLYMEIGKKVHEIYQYGGSLGKYFDEKYLELEAAERKVAEIKEQISIIKGVRECPKCEMRREGHIRGPFGAGVRIRRRRNKSLQSFHPKTARTGTRIYTLKKMRRMQGG
jgi:hypothetical protein